MWRTPSSAPGAASQHRSRSPSPSPAPSQAPHVPSHRDVHAVRALLHRALGLPTELADMVIDAAEYYPVLSIERKQFCQVTASSMENNKAAAPYLISDPVPEASADELVKIKAVRFRMKSHDQGWGGDRGCAGTYRASYTWFEARILRREPGGCIIPEWQNDMTAPTRIVPDPGVEAPRFRRHGWDFVAQKGRQGWSIQHNMTARPHFRVHEVEWRADEPMEEVEGTGDGDGFVEALRPGDRVAVYARAMFPGWANHVAEFQIDIQYSI